MSTYLCKKSINSRVVCSAPVRNQSRVTKLFRTQREILNIQSVLVTRKLRRWIDQDIVARIELTLVQFISRLFSRIREFCNATISYKPLYRILLPKPLRTHFPNLWFLLVIQYYLRFCLRAPVVILSLFPKVVVPMPSWNSKTKKPFANSRNELEKVKNKQSSITWTCEVNVRLALLT